MKHCRSILEFAAPAWHGAITEAERQDIERVQKVTLHIILGDQYETYRNALGITNLEMLEVRRNNLCMKFAKKSEKNEKHKHWFKLNPKTITRREQEKYKRPVARTTRLLNSPISYLTQLLNKYYKK